MRRAMMLLLTLCFALLGLSGCTMTVTSVPVGSVAEDGSVYLGFTLISHKPDKDFMLIGSEQGTFASVRLHVTSHDLNLERMVITFGNGEQWSPPLRERFAKGSWSREIALPGKGPRHIRKVVFVGKATGKSGLMAKVELYGRR
jgi:hypothetical protein